MEQNQQPTPQPDRIYNIPDDAIIQLRGNEYIALFKHLENSIALHSLLYKKLEALIISGIATEITQEPKAE